ncbi:MAG: mechanosensitive ion channel family protein, partial [Bradymonadaceae bacterium]
VGRVEISLFSILHVALIVGVTILATKLFKAILNAKIYPTLDVEIGVAYAVNTLINYALFMVAFFLCLFALGVHLSAVVVVIASLGVGIGFGLQTLTENLISGFIILFGRSVKKGDFITVNSVYGQVEAVGARSVVVRTPDNYDMLIPSKEIVSGQIINWTYHDSVVRIHIPVGVSYKSHPREVERVLKEACSQYPLILESPAPEVWLTSFGDSSINFSLLIYFDCRQITERKLRGQFNFVVWDALEAAKIQIPFPQRDVHLKSTDASPEMTKKVMGTE